MALAKGAPGAKGERMVMGMGVDVVRVERIERLLARRSRRFERRVFSPAEVAECHRDRRPGRRFAERFALKEAALKAIGTGWAQGVGWRDVDARFPCGRGAPVVTLSGRAAEIAGDLGVEQLHATVGGSGRFAVACVVLEGPDA